MGATVVESFGWGFIASSAASNRAPSMRQCNRTRQHPSIHTLDAGINHAPAAAFEPSTRCLLRARWAGQCPVTCLGDLPITTRSWWLRPARVFGVAEWAHRPTPHHPPFPAAPPAVGPVELGAVRVVTPRRLRREWMNG
jgi:hypothetical protein